MKLTDLNKNRSISSCLHTTFTILTKYATKGIKQRVATSLLHGLCMATTFLLVFYAGDFILKQSLQGQYPYPSALYGVGFLAIGLLFLVNNTFNRSLFYKLFMDIPIKQSLKKSFVLTVLQTFFALIWLVIIIAGGFFFMANNVTLSWVQQHIGILSIGFTFLLITPIFLVAQTLIYNSYHYLVQDTGNTFAFFTPYTRKSISSSGRFIGGNILRLLLLFPFKIILFLPLIILLWSINLYWGSTIVGDKVSLPTYFIPMAYVTTLFITAFAHYIGITKRYFNLYLCGVIDRLDVNNQVEKD